MKTIVNKKNWNEHSMSYQSKISQIDIINKTWKKARNELSKQWKLGAFYTPDEAIFYLVNEAFIQYIKNVGGIENVVPENIKILEPSVWIWSFIPFVVNKLLEIYLLKYGVNNTNEYIKKIFEYNIYMCDIDVDIIPLLKERLLEIVNDFTFDKFNIFVGSFFENDFSWTKFDIVIWNPPYGADMADWKVVDDKSKRILTAVDKKFNKRYGLKIKKESYSYFIVHSIELLTNNWVISFITSDTFLTIGTFLGLRNFIFTEGTINKLIKSPKNLFMPYTTYPTASIIFTKNTNNKQDSKIDFIAIEKKEDFLKENFLKETITIPLSDILALSNKPLNIDAYEYSKYFKDTTTLSNILKTVWGLTTWNNSLLVEEYKEDIHLNLIWSKYEYYNKSMPGVKWFCNPKYVIKWENNGDNIREYKKSTWKWYLQGMGGKDYYFREGLAINLIWSKINARYIEKWKYVFDAGSPMIVFNENILNNEMLFILWYFNSNIASKILKNVLNHTRNIQPKNIEALPYPKVSQDDKNLVITLVKNILQEMKTNTDFNYTEFEKKINNIFDNI